MSLTANPPGVLAEEIDLPAPPEQLFAALQDRAGSFFLDSSLRAGGLGAYSFIGFDPFLLFQAKGTTITLNEQGVVHRRRGDPLEELRELLRRYQGMPVAGLPFAGGAVGTFSYELCSQLERIQRTSPDDAGIPDIELGFYDGVLAFEIASGRSWLAAQAVYRDSPEQIARRLRATVDESWRRYRPGQTAEPKRERPIDLQANFSKEEYLRAIGRVKNYIAAGDVYQVNLAQRFESELRCPPYTLYERLRRRSPSPFGAYLSGSGGQVLSSSPERFLRIREGRVDTRPIKGTRPRGGTPAEDARLRQELILSAKDRAELLMIVDLERNDLGRVCAPGSIAVDELFRLESHPTVHHLVAAVSGRLREGADIVDCLRAMFPGGSITGAPKVRAMQIIDELEPCRRYGYTGAMGYLGFDGNCDLNIAIRTIFCRQGRAAYHVGGGIVWDSVPESEYQETLDKGRALHAALNAES
jgi:para-aminobenzoate synthetase component I